MRAHWKRTLCLVLAVLLVTAALGSVPAKAAGGSIEQVGWGRNYGARISAFQGNLNRILYDRTIKAFIETCNDGNVVFVPYSHGIDPVKAYPRTEKNGNALHGTQLSGFQAGDALFAWLLNDITNR